jgi:phosphatidate phosphatase LPIN
LRPPQELLRSLHLREGRNKIEFSVTSRLQGKRTVSAAIYLWRSNSKIVISDVDGTITKYVNRSLIGHIHP